MGSLSLFHWIIVIVVVMLLFGRGKISDLMGDVAKGINSFKKGLADEGSPTAPPAPPSQISAQPTVASGQATATRDETPRS